MNTPVNVTGDLISGNTVQDDLYGILVDGSGNTVIGNTVDFNGGDLPSGVPYGGGIVVDTSGWIVVSGNTVNHNYLAGINITAGARRP